MTDRKVLFLYPQSLGPEPEPRRNAHHYLSRRLHGDMIVDWTRRPEHRAEQLARTTESIGRFGFHFDDEWGLRQRFGGARALQFYISRGLELIRSRGPYDAIVAYGPYRTGMAALALRARTGVPVVVEVPGNHLRSYDFDARRYAGVRRALARPVLREVTRRADLVRLLYPTQLDEVGRPDAARTATFHNFASLDLIRGDQPRDKTILFLGYPFYLKGVDILIPAFRAVVDRHPGWNLHIMGHCPEPGPFVELAGGDPRIRISRAVPNAQAMPLMERCGIFVLPSRTEAMGRVLLEAMAARRPIIASRVDGIPHYVTHGDNGLLFESENIADLSAQLDRLMGDEALADRLAAAGHQRATGPYSVASYVDQFAEMIERVVELRAVRRRS